jgi:hypothetical protein
MEKKKYFLDVSYYIVTEESAQEGSAEEEGMYEMGIEFDSLEDMARYIVDEGGAEFSGSSEHGWFSTVYPLRDYKTGAETYYNFHPDGLSAGEHAELMVHFQKALKRL